MQRIKRWFKRFKAIIFLIIAIIIGCIVRLDAYADFIKKILVLLNVESDTQTIITISSALLEIAGILPIGILGCKYANHANLAKTYRKALFEHIRNELCAVLKASKLAPPSLQPSDIDIRIFEKKCHYFILKNIEGCYDNQIRGDIRFDIDKNEGLVSEAYSNRETKCEINNASDTRYSLSSYNQSKVGNLQFLLTVPIFEQNNKIEYVICFDSMKRICQSAEKITQYKAIMERSAHDFYDYFAMWKGDSDNEEAD